MQVLVRVCCRGTAVVLVPTRCVVLVLVLVLAQLTVGLGIVRHAQRAVSSASQRKTRHGAGM